MENNRRLYYLALAVIAASILAFMFYSFSSRGEKPEQAANPEAPGVKGYCLLEMNSLECKLLVNNTFNGNTYYLSRIVLNHGGMNTSIDLGLSGITVSPYLDSSIVVHVMPERTVTYLESYIQEAVVERKPEGSPVKLVEELRRDEPHMYARNLTIYRILPPGEGVILPMDYRFNITNSSIAVLIHVSSNISSLYLDVKEFAWNDVIYYETTRHAGSDDYILLPVPGSNNNLIISRIVVNVINDNPIPANVTVSGYLFEVPSMDVDLYFVGSLQRLRVPVICYDCLINTIHEG